jgi:energy-coupling factor transporter ATP-binding protein EcfA2
MFALNDVLFSYDNSEKNALDGVSLTIARGEFLGITGSAGAGKTSLLRVMNGLVPQHYSGVFSGSCLFTTDDNTVFDTTHTKPLVLSRYIGMVFQDFESQLLTSIVEDEVAFGLENFGIDDIEHRITETLDACGISALRHRQIHSLSGGQKQKVAIASILALEPRCILLDEPTAELDPEASVMIFSLLKEVNRTRGTSVVVVEQKKKLLAEYADRVLVMEEGRIV